MNRANTPKKSQAEIDGEAELFGPFLPSGTHPDDTVDSIVAKHLKKLEDSKLKIKNKNIEYTDDHLELPEIMDEYLNTLIKEKPDDILKFSQKYFKELYKKSNPDDESTVAVLNDDDDGVDYDNDLQQDSNLSNSMASMSLKSPPKTAPQLIMQSKQHNNNNNNQIPKSAPKASNGRPPPPAVLPPIKGK